MGFNWRDGGLERVTVDSFEPGQMIYLGRGDHAADAGILHRESTEAGRGTDPTGRKRDLRFELVIEDARTNVRRIHVRSPGAEEYLFVQQRFTRRN